MKRSQTVLSYLVIAALPFLSNGMAEAKTERKAPARQKVTVKKAKEPVKLALAATSVAGPTIIVAGSVETAPVAAPQAAEERQTPAVAPVAAAPRTNPYLVSQQWIASATPTGPLTPQVSIDQLVIKLKSSLNAIPLFNDEAILPRIKTVHPTGEKPLVVLTFKCPTEAIGITTPPIKALRELVNLSMEGVNRTNLLPFNMQQVCQ